MPSSTNIITATEVIGLLIDAIRKIASVFIGSLFSRFRNPNVSKYAIFPLRAIKTTAPGIAPLSTSDWKASVTRFNRSEEKPTSSGLFALGSPCANDENAMHVAIADMQMIRPNLINTSRLLAKSDCVQELAVQSKKA